jgi:hypothetical protein
LVGIQQRHSWLGSTTWKSVKQTEFSLEW